MAISAPCSWRNSRLEAGPRASGPPGCHGRTFVSRSRRVSMVLPDRSCLSGYLFVAIILPGTTGKVHLVGLSCLYLSSDAPSERPTTRVQRFVIRRLECRHELLCLQTPLHISVCSFDKLHQSRGIDVTFRSEFHMAHELASAFQQALGIGNLGATKEPDIDVSSERIDIRECRITYARGRMAIMQ